MLLKKKSGNIYSQRQLRKHRVQIFQFKQKYYKGGCTGGNCVMVETNPWDIGDDIRETFW